MAVAVGLAKRSRSEVGRGRPPCGIAGLRDSSRENDLFRLSAKTQAFSPKATYRGPAGPISLKTAHSAVFRALDAPESLPSVAGEGFDNRVSRHSCSLFPVACSLCTTLCISANSSINQNFTSDNSPTSVSPPSTASACRALEAAVYSRRRSSWVSSTSGQTTTTASNSMPLVRW